VAPFSTLPPNDTPTNAVIPEQLDPCRDTSMTFSQMGTGYRNLDLLFINKKISRFATSIGVAAPDGEPRQRLAASFAIAKPCSAGVGPTLSIRATTLANAWINSSMAVQPYRFSYLDFDSAEAS
jgi:hypothetical protein